MASETIIGKGADAAGFFEPLTIGGIEIRNRLAVAPMTRVSATETGHATERMADYYAAFAEGGFGLIITEGVYTDQAFSQGYLHQPGLSDDTQRDAWQSVVERVHAGGARFIAQLMHAGALPPKWFRWRGVHRRVRRADGPERVFGEWWKLDAELATARGDFRVEDDAGERCWRYRGGDCEHPETGSQRWFLHGIFG